MERSKQNVQVSTPQCFQLLEHMQHHRPHETLLKLIENTCKQTSHSISTFVWLPHDSVVATLALTKHPTFGLFAGVLWAMHNPFWSRIQLSLSSSHVNFSNKVPLGLFGFAFFLGRFTPAPSVASLFLLAALIDWIFCLLLFVWY